MLRAKERQIRRALSEGASDYEPGDPRPPRPSLEADVGHILAGGDVDDLGDTSPERHRESLVRRLHAIAQAIPVLEDRRRELWVRAIQDACGQLEDIGGQVLAAVIGTFEQTAAVLDYFQRFCEMLNRKGLTTEYRPRTLRFLPFEAQTLFGDSNGRPSLAWWIDQRRPDLEGK